MKVLSVDLAHTSYANLGIVVLEGKDDAFSAAPLAPRDLDLTGTPSPQVLAARLASACRHLGTHILLLDGPQGWKDPHNGLEHCRLGERELNTPGKTGLPGQAKPGPYLPFIAFSIAVFQALLEHGFELWSGPSSAAPFLAIESFPTAAWRHLRLEPLPAKSKTRPGHLQRAASDLRRLFPLSLPDGLSHDEMQALVASLAGVAVARGHRAGYVAAGVAPLRLEGHWHEGFIINPTSAALGPGA